MSIRKSTSHFSSTYSSLSSLSDKNNNNNNNNNKNSSIGNNCCNNNENKTETSKKSLLTASAVPNITKRKVYRKKRKSTLSKSISTDFQTSIQLTDIPTVNNSITNSNETNHKESSQQTTNNSNNLFYLQYLKSICFVMLCKSKFSSNKSTTNIDNKTCIKIKKFSRSSSMSLIGSKNHNKEKFAADDSKTNNTNEFYDLKLEVSQNTLLKPIESIPSEYDDDCFNNKNNQPNIAKLKTNKQPFNLNCNYSCELKAFSP